MLNKGDKLPLPLPLPPLLLLLLLLLLPPPPQNSCNNIHPSSMVCYKYKIVNALHKCDDDDNNTRMLLFCFYYKHTLRVSNTFTNILREWEMLPRDIKLNFSNNRGCNNINCIIGYFPLSGRLLLSSDVVTLTGISIRFSWKGTTNRRTT
jgi:hypothetical protein